MDKNWAELFVRVEGAKAEAHRQIMRARFACQDVSRHKARLQLSENAATETSGNRDALVTPRQT
jgi:hypothetical protein